MDGLFQQYYQRYQQLRAMLSAGKMTPAQFEAEVSKLRWNDNLGKWWMLDAASGAPLYYDGARWVPAQVPPPTPGAYAAPQVGRGYPPIAGMQARPKGMRAMLLATPILALIPSLVCGSLWFLYTFIGVFKNEGLSGLDLGTPIIVIGLPLLFWIFKKPLDQLLLPLKPVVTSFPRPLRLGFALAVPLVMSFGCSLTSNSGYLALNLASLISILTAAVVMRY